MVTLSKAIHRLNVLQVAKYAKAPGRYSDGGGLLLMVSGKSAASWTLRFDLNKRKRWMGLRSYPEIGLAEARQMAADARRLVVLGQGPD
jgi:hypothetical protein